MKLLSAVVGNTAFQLAGKAITAASTVLVMGLLDRTYTGAGLGIFTLATIFLAPFYLAVEFGLNPVAVRRYTERSSGVFFTTLIGSRLVLSGVCMVVVLPLSFLLTRLPGTANSFPKDFWLGVLIASPTLITYGLYQSAVSIFQWKLAYKYSVIALALGTLVTLTVSFWLASRGFPLPYIFGAYTIGSMATAATALYLAGRYLKSRFIFWRVSGMRNLILQALPFAITLIFNTLYFRLDSFILSGFHGVSAAGRYNAGYAVFANLLVLPTFIMNSLYPMLLASRGTNAYARVVVRSLICMAVLGVSLAVVSFVAAPWFMHLWLKESAAGALSALMWLLPGVPVFFLSALVLWLLVTANKLWWLPWIYLIGMAVNALGNILFIPAFGFRAAAVMTIAGELVVLGIATLLILTHKKEVL